MVTSITFQFQRNKKFHNPELKPPGVYGERDTNDLQKLLKDDMEFLDKIYGIVEDLNKRGLDNTPVAETIKFWTGVDVQPRNHTKKKRTYFIGGLTIHEEDQTM